MPLKSLVLNRIFYRTYNQFLITLLISLNQYARTLIATSLQCFYLILPVLKLMWLKTILNMPTALLSNWKPMQDPITLTVLMIHIKLHMQLCQHLLLLIMKLNNNTSMDISAMLTNLVLPPMDLVLSVPLISTTRIILLPILILLLKRNQNLQMKTNLLLTQKLYCLH